MDDLLSDDGEWMFSGVIGKEPDRRIQVYVSVQTLLSWKEVLGGSAEAVMDAVGSLVQKLEHEILEGDSTGGLNKVTLYSNDPEGGFSFPDVNWFLDTDENGVEYVAVELADQTAERLFGEEL